ncbi:hypothetical protein POVCU2_0063420 [Plasmodium ovale curtisi]|uniref:Uncharacterized protein n=1 Tax=Plasmodium ovale curtisi TaxID=864141 RepID=A0A1A8WCM7_PLAOA|nr:hypothetical protein POVCU2_0063420 [Plasmodium ovale curtisi]
MAVVKDNELEDRLKELQTYQIYNVFDYDVQRTYDRDNCLNLEIEKGEAHFHSACYKMRKFFIKYSNDINKEYSLSTLRGVVTRINYKYLSDMPCGYLFDDAEKV